MSPCKDCTEHGKDLYCHSTCQAFLDYQTQSAAISPKKSPDMYVPNAKYTGAMRRLRLRCSSAAR